MSLLKKLYGLSLVSSLLGSVASCGLVTDAPDAPCPPSETIALSFHMITSSPMPGSRADALHSESDSEFRWIEDGIDVKDLGLFIFAKGPESSSEELVLKNTDIASSTDPQMMITGSPGSYFVTLIIRKAEMKKKLNYEITPDGPASIQFRVLVLANCKSSFTSSAPDSKDWDSLTAETYDALIEQAKAGQFNVAVQLDHSANLGDSDVTGIYKGRIPMFGTNVFSVTERALYESGPSQRVNLGTVDLLRSLAKVRVVDNIGNKTDGYPKITQVEFIGSQESAYVLPADAAGYVNGSQIHNPNIYDPEKTLSFDDVTTYKLGTIPDGWNMTDEANRKGETRIGYVPEQPIANVDGVVDKGLPMFRITAALQVNPDGSVQSQTYDVPMTGYNPAGSTPTPFEFGSDILRNHIYTLSVNHIAVGVPADITVNVQPWTPSTLDLSYTESVTVSNRIEWDEDSYAGFDPATGEVYAKPWNNDTPILLECSFKIRTPENAQWTAFLIQKDGSDNGAFMFTDKDGNNPSAAISGTVVNNSELTTLYIKPTIQSPTELNSAVLQVVVTLGNNTTIEVPLTPSNQNYKNFTIVQNKQ